MAATEFYTNFSTGANTSAGSTEGAPVTTLTGGNWVSATGVFTKAGADLSGVSVGMFAAVMVDAGTLAAIVGRITAVDDGADTVTVSTTAKSGTLADQTATATLTVGGVWKGPNAAVGFPVGFIANTLTNAAGDFPRINMKNNATYAITAVMTHANAGPTIFQGYTSTVGDGGRAIIDGGTSGASYVLLNQNGANVAIRDIIWQNNGATGFAAGLIVTNGAGTASVFTGCVVKDIRGHGVNIGAAQVTLEECEFYGCNQFNAGTLAAVNVGNVGFLMLRCTIHDNVQSSNNGVILAAGAQGDIIDSVIESNGAKGILIQTASAIRILGSDIYSNGGDGIDLANTAANTFVIENCNLVKNGGYGINGSGSGGRIGYIRNCGFGSGNQINTSGTTTGLKAMVESGSITYAANVTPWVDPANGDFRINLATAKGTGRGTFTQTAASYTGTVGYPDVGAAQHVDSGGGGGIVVPTQVLGTESVGIGT